MQKTSKQQQQQQIYIYSKYNIAVFAEDKILFFASFSTKAQEQKYLSLT